MRGSGQPAPGSENYGPENNAVYFGYKRAIEDLLQDGTSYQIVDLDYPAVAVGTSGINNSFDAEASWWPWGEYRGSVSKGVKNLKDRLTVVNNVCPQTRFMLAGYSQGAQVVGDTLPELVITLRDKILNVTLFGDPKHNPKAGVLYFGSSRNTSDGQLEARDPYVPRDMHLKTHSWCNYGDGICNNHAAVDGFTGNGRHGSYGADNGRVASQAGRVAMYGYLAWRDSQNGFFDKIELEGGMFNWAINKQRETQDIVLVIDRSLSMYPIRDAMKTHATLFAEKLMRLSSNTKVGVISFSDHEFGYDTKWEIEPTTSISKIAEALQGITLEGPRNTDFPETGLSGIMQALHETKWRNGATKRIITFTDDYLKNPDIYNDKTYTTGDAISLSRSIDPVHLDFIHFGSTGPERQAQFLADETGGIMFAGAHTNAQTVIQSLDTFVARVESSPTIFAGEQYIGYVGEPINFNVAANNNLARYWGCDWDFEGDGTVDEFIGYGNNQHVYQEPFNGYARISCRYLRGTTRATAIPRVTIMPRPTLAVAPGAPTNVRAMLASNSDVALSWSAPSESGSSEIVGYVVSDSDGLPLFYTSNKTEFTIRDIPPSEVVELTVLAVNSEAKSLQSESVKIETPPAQTESEEGERGFLTRRVQLKKRIHRPLLSVVHLILKIMIPSYQK